jgi:CheY-like chemotaxis protein
MQKNHMCVSAQTYLRSWRKNDVGKSNGATINGQLRAFNVRLKGQTLMSLFPSYAKTPERSTRSASQPTVLVVEDHDDTREMLCMLSKSWGCRVVEACNGLEAVEAALRERPQVILMDSRLPYIDGLEATRRIRERGLWDQVKILALDGSGSPHYHAAALAAGCNDSIAKPFDIEELRTYVAGGSSLTQ